MSKAIDLSILKAAAAHKRGELAAAYRLLQEVLRQFPNNARAKRGLEALRSAALPPTAGPGEIAAQFELATQMRFAGQYDDAGAIYRRILEVQPDHGGADHGLGAIAMANGRSEEALAFFERAARSSPNIAGIASDLGGALQAQDRLEEAAAAFRRAIFLKPDFADAHGNLGNVLKLQHKFDQAQASYDRALAIDPDAVDTHCNLATLSLLRGNFETGWPHYQWRLKSRVSAEARYYPQPLWLGEEDIAGTSLLVHAEQGLGDTIQFVRYALLARTRGAEVTLAVQPTLVPLLREAFADMNVRAEDAALPSADYRIPMLSLPLAVDRRGEAMAELVPYLRADPDRVRKWTDRLGPAGFKIGICWQGSTGPIDKGRSFALAAFAGVATLPGVRLISLHKGAGEEQLRALPQAMRVETLGEDFDVPGAAFLDTAAVMAQCDLVISSDTAVAHLAGAMGVPVWVALQHLPDWRWQLDRADSPWYPSMRLFRQPAPGDWRSVFAAIEAALNEPLERQN